MGPFLQTRLWFKQAAREERLAAVNVGVLVLALLAWALVPPSDQHEDADLAVVASSPARDESGSGDDVPQPESPGSAPLEASPSATGAPATPDATGAGARPQGDGQRPVTDTATGSSGNAPLTASDRGVTASTIKVGFAMINVGGVEQAGYASGNRTDTSQVIDALVAAANRDGGVLGRKVAAAKASVDLIGREDQRQKCIYLTETEKVFSVIDSIAFIYETSSACIAAEHKTPLISGMPGSAEAVRKGYPYIVSTQNDDNRKMKNLVMAAKADGFFDPARGFKKLGILSDACQPTVLDDPEIGLKAYLRQIGITEWSEFRSDCDVASQQRSGPPAVLQHRQDGVSHVLLAAQAALVPAYLSAAQAQGWKPEYYVSDYVLLAMDGNAQRFDPEQFDRTRGVTQLHVGELVKGKPFSPRAQQCSKIFEVHGLAPIQHKKDYTNDFEALMLCENFQLWLQAARAAGPDLTRPAWAASLQQVGEFRAALADLARFAPGKTTGGDTLKPIEWHADCKCWHEAGPFRPAYE